MKIESTRYTRKEFHRILTFSISIFILCIILSIGPHGVYAQDGEPIVNFYIERELVGHLDDITALSWSDNGLWIASGSSDNSTKIWSTSNWNEVRTFPHPASVNEISWSKNTQRLAISYGNGSIDIYNSVGWSLVKNLTQHIDDVKALDWNPTGSAFASGDDTGIVEIWDTSSWSSVKTLSMPGGIKDLKWSNDGTKLAACSDEGTIRVWDTIMWLDFRSFDVTSENEATESIEWSPDDSELVTSSDDDMVRVWDTVSWNTVQNKDVVNPNKIEWGSDGSYVVVGTVGGVKIWSTTSWEGIQTNGTQGNYPVSAISFNPDGDMIATGSPSEENKTVLIWEKNLSPLLDTIGDINTLEDEPITFTVTASDDDTVFFSDDSDLFDIDPNSGQISFTPTNDDVGEHEITITVDDRKGGVDSEIITFTVINVDDPPEPVFNWKYGSDYLNITLKIAGDSGNSVSLHIIENGTQIEELIVNKGEGILDEGILNLPLDIFQDYNMSLEFEGENGDSPIALSFERAGIIITDHFLFESDLGSSQTVDLDLENYFKSMGLVILDGSQSIDIDSEIIEYKWVFWYGETKYGESFVHHFPMPALHNVSFILETDNGVNRSLHKNIPVHFIHTQDSINTILSKHSTLKYLESTNQIAISSGGRANLIIRDERGRITGYVDNEYMSEISGITQVFINQYSEAYFIPSNTEFSLDFHNDVPGHELRVVRSIENSQRTIILRNFLGNVTLRIEENHNSFSISTEDHSLEYELQIFVGNPDEYDTFNLVRVNITSNEDHHYIINKWEAIKEEGAVNLGIDKDKDGLVDLTIDLEDQMTGEEIQVIIRNMGKSSSTFFTTSLILLIIGFIGITGFGVIFGSTEVGKLALLALILPLYTKIKKEEILDNEIRGMIRGYIIANPGDNYNSIKRALGLNNGTIAYHLKVLEKARIIKSRQNGIYKRFYPASMNIPNENGAQISEIQRLVLMKIKESPGISQKEIAKLLGLSKGVLNYHVKILLNKNMLKMEKRGRRTLCFINSGIEDKINSKDKLN